MSNLLAMRTVSDQGCDQYLSQQTAASAAKGLQPLAANTQFLFLACRDKTRCYKHLPRSESQAIAAFSNRRSKNQRRWGATLGHRSGAILPRQAWGVGIRHMARGRSRLLSVIELFTTMGERGGIGRLARVPYKASRAGGHLCFLMCGLFFLVGLSTCYAGDVVHIHGKRQYPTEDETVRRLADFYGLTLYTVDVGSQDAVNRAMSRMRSPGTLAVLTSQDALSELDRKQVQAALRRPKGPGIPILVFGIAAQEDANELKLWSGGALKQCAPLVNDFRPKVLEVGRAGALTRALAGVDIPAVASPTCSMQFEPAPAIQTVLAARGDGGANAAVLVRVQSKTAETFFVPQMEPFDLSRLGKPWQLPTVFSSMAPFILFLSYAAGDYGWHLDGHYANLTIDDPWLTQPYGHLDYPALLVQMENHNFHTTIAFIPWNFDRSEPAIVTLFRAHPERFSICVHGNNHDHKEFGDYVTTSLREQIADIRLGVARMERFRAMTGIPYDRFMVFPHGVAPEGTFAVLKRYDFLGTTNLVSVPLDATFPTDPAFLLRPYTVAFANFLSMSRYPVGAQFPQLEIAIQSFLGNPLLLYGHEDLFVEGIGAFNAFADYVNQVQLNTQWTNLGEIARHSHLVRRREDGAFEARMFSNEMDLKNPTDRDAVFYVKWEEDFSSAIRSLTIDGIPAAFERSKNMEALRLVIPARQVRKFRISYQNDLDLSREDIRKSGVRTYALRRISDFRDLYLSRFSWGRDIKKYYYRHGWNLIELYLEQKWWVYVTCMALAFVVLRYRRLRTRKQAAKRATN